MKYKKVFFIKHIISMFAVKYMQNRSSALEWERKIEIKRI